MIVDGCRRRKVGGGVHVGVGRGKLEGERMFVKGLFGGGGKLVKRGRRKVGEGNKGRVRSHLEPEGVDSSFT